MAVTLADLARESGFSKLTVSCALRGLERVAPKTKARILAVAKELGYQPNAPAAMLALQRHRAVEPKRQVLIALLRPAGREDETRFPVFRATAWSLGLAPRIIGCDMSRSPDLL